MNKYQSTTLILGFTLIAFTWVYGNSQFQVYKSLSGFGREGKEAVVEQKIRQEILTPTVVAEGIGIGILVYLFKDSKNKK